MDAESRTLTSLGYQKLTAGDLDGAVETLLQAVSFNCADADAFAMLGIAYSEKGLAGQAQQALLRAIDLEPGKASHRCNYGVVLERAGQYIPAAEMYRHALTIDSEHEVARTRLSALRPEVSSDATSQSLLPHETVVCARCNAWTQIGLLCEACGTPLPPRVHELRVNDPQERQPDEWLPNGTHPPISNTVRVFDSTLSRRTVLIVCSTALICVALTIWGIVRHRLPGGKPEYNTIKIGDRNVRFVLDRATIDMNPIDRQPTFAAGSPRFKRAMLEMRLKSADGDRLSISKAIAVHNEGPDGFELSFIEMQCFDFDPSNSFTVDGQKLGIKSVMLYMAKVKHGVLDGQFGGDCAISESMGMLSQSHVLFSGTLHVPVEIANRKD